jgi:hypothetical protein
VLPVGAESKSVGSEKLRRLGDVVAQESFLPAAVVRSLHPRSVAPKEAVALLRLIGRGNDDERKLNFVVVFHNRFSELTSAFALRKKKGSPTSETSERLRTGDGLVASIRGQSAYRWVPTSSVG